MLMVRTRQSYFNPKSLILTLHYYVSERGMPLIEVRSGAQLSPEVPQVSPSANVLS